MTAGKGTSLMSKAEAATVVKIGFFCQSLYMAVDQYMLNTTLKTKIANQNKDCLRLPSKIKCNPAIVEIEEYSCGKKK